MPWWIQVSPSKRIAHKGVGEGGHKVGAHVGLCPRFFGQIKCSNFAIWSYFVVKNAKIFKILLGRSARQLNFINIVQWI